MSDGAAVCTRKQRHGKREVRADPMPWGVSVSTVMVRQIPTKLTQLNFLQEIRQHGFDGVFDFLYIPYDLKRNTNVGYGFINFTKPEHALRFRDQLDGTRIGSKDHKPIRIHPASLQGYEANYNHFSGTKTAQKHDPRISPLFLKPFQSGYAEGLDAWLAEIESTNTFRPPASYGLDFNARPTGCMDFPMSYDYWSTSMPPPAVSSSWNDTCEGFDYEQSAQAYSTWLAIWDGQRNRTGSECSGYADAFGSLSTEASLSDHQLDDVDFQHELRAPPGFELYNEASAASRQKSQVAPREIGSMPPGLESVNMFDHRGKVAEDPMSWNADVVTVMVRQLPATWTQHMFLNMVRERGYDGLFNFVYVPFDTVKRKNIGYGFINFMQPQDALRFRDQFDGVHLDDKSKKPLHVHPALLQGYKSNYEHFMQTRVAHSSDPRVSPIFVPSVPTEPLSDERVEFLPLAEPMMVPLPNSFSDYKHFGSKSIFNHQSDSMQEVKVAVSPLVAKIFDNQDSELPTLLPKDLLTIREGPHYASSALSWLEAKSS